MTQTGRESGRPKSILGAVVTFPILRAITLGAILAGGSWESFAMETQQPRDRSWRFLMRVYAAGVVADAATTRRGLQAGAQEANPIYSWAGEEGVPALRLTVGGVACVGLNSLHRSHPRLAKWLASVGIAFSVAAVINNRRVEAEMRAGP